MSSTHIRFDNGGEIDDYELSNSEDEYTEREKTLLRKARLKPTAYSDSEEEVFGLNEENSEEDSNIAESDIEGKDDDDLPDARAWGKTKRHFYSTDYVDQDYGGFQGKDAVAAEFEEEEAKNIQKRLAEQLDDADFSLEFFTKKPEVEDETNEELIKSDLSTLSKRELLQLLQKESPEFFVLVDDYKAKMKEMKDCLFPIIQQDKDGIIPECEAMNFVKILYHLILNYCSNIHMYLLLKASKMNVKTHPVVKRLYQYRQLIAQMEPIYTEIIRPQIEIMIKTNPEKSGIKSPKKKKLKLLANLNSVSKKTNSGSLDEPVPKTKKIKFSENLNSLPKQSESSLDETVKKNQKSILKSNKSESKQVSFELSQKEKITQKYTDNDDSEQEVDSEQNDEGDTEDSKRAITYQMKKNKGLTPKRKKELRNPRVKHRNKFRKAKIRRKGAVREVRKETTRYSGEISGIKASVSKSIKFK